MKRPWQVWMVFVSCVVLVVAAMAWVTLKVTELHRREAAARKQVELEELVNSALWRMDTMLAPLLAQEASRPFHAYWPISPETAGVADSAAPLSPLLVQPSEFVILHFQYDAHGRVSSSQVPAGHPREKER